MANESKFRLSLPALEIDRILKNLINIVKTVNGVEPDESGNVDVSITDEETFEILIQEDMLPVVADSDGAILADENNNILLW